MKPKTTEILTEFADPAELGQRRYFEGAAIVLKHFDLVRTRVDPNLVPDE